jgi:hypothetical protein
LGKVADGRAGDLRVEKEGRSLNLLADKEPNSGEHSNTAVSHFGLTVSLHGGLIGLFGKAKRVKEANRGKNTGKFLSYKSVEGGSFRKSCQQRLAEL